MKIKINPELRLFLSKARSQLAVEPLRSLNDLKRTRPSNNLLRTTTRKAVSFLSVLGSKSKTCPSVGQFSSSTNLLKALFIPQENQSSRLLRTSARQEIIPQRSCPNHYRPLSKTFLAPSAKSASSRIVNHLSKK
jgi:hypothetical protein